MLTRRRSALLFGAMSPLLAACGGGEATSGSSGASVAVVSSDESCELERTDFESGHVTFAVTNDGSATTEVYVYGEDHGKYTRVISEVENIGPGTSRDLEVDLSGGTYEVACKPGQTGDGIRTRITVTGDGAPEAGSGEAGGSYDREIELTTDGTAITGLDGGAATGETIEFKLTNNSDASRVLELKNPAGAVVAEVQIEPGATGEAIVELGTAGTWQVVVEGDGVEDLVSELPVT